MLKITQIYVDKEREMYLTVSLQLFYASALNELEFLSNPLQKVVHISSFCKIYV